MAFLFILIPKFLVFVKRFENFTTFK